MGNFEAGEAAFPLSAFHFSWCSFPKIVSLQLCDVYNPRIQITPATGHADWKFCEL